MKSSQSRLLVGLLLVASGALFLLQNLNIIRLPDLGELFLAAFFGLGALAFLAVYILLTTSGRWRSFSWAPIYCSGRATPLWPPPRRIRKH
ncbi:MAG: hypothetical protein ACOC8X_12505 [Chloroflexota bacterium]